MNTVVNFTYFSPDESEHLIAPFSSVNHQASYSSLLFQVAYPIPYHTLRLGRTILPVQRDRLNRY